MMYKFVFALAALMVLVASSPMKSPSYSLIPVEEPCVRQGGICVREDQCEPSNLVNLGVVLCPLQKHLGAECCYEYGGVAVEKWFHV